MNVIDEATKIYLDEKFEGLREVLKLTVDPINKQTEKNTDEITLLKPIKDKLDNHLDDHIRNDGRKKFNTEMWIIIAIFAGQSILQFFTK